MRVFVISKIDDYDHACVEGVFSSHGKANEFMTIEYPSAKPNKAKTGYVLNFRSKRETFHFEIEEFELDLNNRYAMSSL